MKFSLIVLILVLTVVAVFSAPIHEETIQRGVRHRRFTCDVLGFMGDSACATNCLSLGKAGGTCQNGICVCRRDTLQDQLDKRLGPPSFDVNPTMRRPSGPRNAPSPY